MRWMNEENGQAAVLTAVCIVFVLGMVALAVDVGHLRYEKRQLQTAADAAALSGALEVPRCTSSDCATLLNAAQQALTENGLSGSTLLTQCSGTPSGLTLTVNNGPCALGSSDPNHGNSNFVETVVSEPVSTYFAKVLGPSFASVTISARAEAMLGSSRNCLYIGGGGVIMNSNDTLTASCGINDNGSFMANSNVTISAENAISIHGTLTNNGATMTPTPVTGTPLVSDPLSYLTPPSAGSCTNLNPIQGAGNTMNPGTYCGLNVNSSSTLTLNPGTYIFEGGVNLGSNTTLSGNGVTLYFTSGSLQMNSNTLVDLVAPTSTSECATCYYPGILLWQSSTNSTGMTIDSNSSSTWQGAIYLPDATLTLNSNGNLAAYTIVDANQLIENSNNSFTLGSDYSSLPGGSPIKGTSILIE
jgi:Flp pilus assembly protein TadG